MDKYISMWKVREFADKVTNVVMNYTEIEGKVREATNEEAWGPTGQLMQELALSTFTYEHFPEVMSMLWRRMLQDNKFRWRRTYKGVNVRHKVRELIDFIQDDDKLREERKKAKKNKDKYIGMSSDAMGGGGRAADYSDQSWDTARRTPTQWGSGYTGEDDQYDAEREDSDEDGHRSGRSKVEAYRDAIETPPARSKDAENKDNSTSLSSSRSATANQHPTSPGQKVNVSIGKSPNKTNTKGVKKIDLGAAAQFAKTAEPTIKDSSPDVFQTCPPPSNDDDFNPRAEEPPPKDQDFGDFANAFVKPQQAPSDEFADFGTAFSPSNAATPAGNQPIQPVDLLGAPPSSVKPSSGLLDLTLDTQPAAGNFIVGQPLNHSNNTSLTAQMGGLSLNPLDAESELRDTVGAIGLSGEAVRLKVQQQPLPQVLNTLTVATDRMLNVLQSTQCFKSQKNLSDVLAELKVLQLLLPGPITKERLCGQDKSCVDWANYAQLYYTPIITNLLQKFSSNWPMRGDIIDYNVASLFLIEDCFEFSSEILSTLCKELKTCDKNKLKPIVQLIVRYLKSDCILVAIVKISQMEPDEELDLGKSASAFSQWNGYVQSLISLPERVANRLKGIMPNEMIPQNFCSHLVFHLVRAIDFMSDSCYHVDTRYSLKFLSHLLSKVIVHFNDSCKSPALLDMINIFVSWTLMKQIDVCLYLRKRMIQNILENLSNQAAETFAILSFKSIPIDYHLNSYLHFPLCNILGKAVAFNKDWEYILCNKLPLMIHMPPERTLLLENLMLYISLCVEEKSNDNLLSNMVLKISSVWANRIVFNHSTINERLYLTQGLIMSLHYLTYLSQCGVMSHIVAEVKKSLFDGVPMHLESLDTQMRAVGMSAAEICLNILALNEPPVADRPTLKFDYADLGDAGVKIHELLLACSKKCALNPYFTPDPAECSVRYEDGFEIIARIGREIYGEVAEKSFSSIQNLTATTQNEDNACVTDINHSESTQLHKSFNIADLDSDDDLEPYDMSADLPASVSKRPLFLRDLRECLLEASDPEAFQESLNVAEDLIYEQLPNEDSEFAIEIFDLMLHLENKYAVENFHDLRTSACIGIVCIHPTFCAEHICKEFHTPMGRYSVMTKLLLLDIISESAGRLSLLGESQPNKKNTTDKKEVRVKSKPEADISKSTEQIILERIRAKTRYFHSKSKHPFAKAKKNTFFSCAKHFFYPLLHGYGKSHLSFVYHHDAKDPDLLILQHYLGVIAKLLIASKNCPDVPKFAMYALELVSSLRYHTSAKIRSGAMSIIVAALLSTPIQIMNEACFPLLLEFELWLTDDLTQLNRGSPVTEYILIARSTFNLLCNYLNDSREGNLQMKVDL